MVPQPPVKLYTPSIISTLKNSMQTVGPLCKCLFGPSDPRTTSEMLRDELKKEERRLKDTWSFDLRQALSPLEKRARPATDKPQSPKRRFVWERQDPKDVPYFYSKPFASPRLSNIDSSDSSVGESPVKRRKTHDSLKSSPRPQMSPRPLGCRDENISPNNPQTVSRKRVSPSSRLCVPLFAASAPATFADCRTVPTHARVVSALRVPTATEPTKQLKTAADRSRTTETAPVSNSSVAKSPVPSTTNTLVSSPERTTSCKKTSRQLFSKRSSPTSSMRSVNPSTQRLITDMLPLKKNRRNAGTSTAKTLQDRSVEERRSSQTTSA